MALKPGGSIEEDPQLRFVDGTHHGHAVTPGQYADYQGQFLTIDEAIAANLGSIS
jgi:hypothetical protein